MCLCVVMSENAYVCPSILYFYTVLIPLAHLFVTVPCPPAPRIPQLVGVNCI